MGRAALRTAPARNSTALAEVGVVVAAGRAGPSRPLAPWTGAATASSRASGRSAPIATGTSALPTSSSTRSAFAVVFSSVWFPYVVVTPSSSTSGLASASKSAIASSCPGSQSRTIGVRTRTEAYCKDARDRASRSAARVRALASRGRRGPALGRRHRREGTQEDLRLPRRTELEPDDRQARGVARPRAFDRGRAAERVRARQVRLGDGSPERPWRGRRSASRLDRGELPHRGAEAASGRDRREKVAASSQACSCDPSPCERIAIMHMSSGSALADSVLRTSRGEAYLPLPSENLVYLGGRRQRGLRAETGCCQRACHTGALERLVGGTTFEERDEEARRERVPRPGSVDHLHRRRLRARDLLALVEQHRALGAERHGDETVAAGQRLLLVAVDDRQIRVDAHRPR